MVDIFCEMCGYEGKIDKSEPKYITFFDIKYVDDPPKASVHWNGEGYICSKCRKELLMFINTKRSEHQMKPIDI